MKKVGGKVKYTKNLFLAFIFIPFLCSCSFVPEPDPVFNKGIAFSVKEFTGDKYTCTMILEMEREG